MTRLVLKNNLVAVLEENLARTSVTQLGQGVKFSILWYTICNMISPELEPLAYARDLSLRSA